MEMLTTEKLSEVQKTELFQLWNKEYPQNLSLHDIASLEKYLDSLSDPFYTLLINKEGQIQAWFADFNRDDARWFAMIIDSQLQGKGNGTMLIEDAKKRQSALNGWVIDDENYKKSDNTFYRSPLGFYKKNGFKVTRDTRLELEKFSAVKIVWKSN
ncbi:GNAT family N-acetyltransferase [Ulvibacter antarcticus]|uniref:N-acetyltransferase domain-containing protein n=1 Tax=Ulvibacter antarcticus TaxID=442714 RepID=A0A3L9YW08_9FLAO|nr:GNAT family N-acetyltransferase [Ulvibacter antarcticus]RMA58652.1 hypothetical protein BXY75_2026 [Ulvibacter antarcticus]